MRLKYWLKLNNNLNIRVILRVGIINDLTNEITHSSNILGLTKRGELYRYSGVDPVLGFDLDEQGRVIYG